MCGIAGIFAYSGSIQAVDPDELMRIREAMARRGPDGAGLWISPDNRIGLAHRRLAIINLSETGAQPMATGDGSIRVTFNGEIYNYRELRRELERKGYAFRTASDTEVLLHLYADRGAEMVHALRGMFAFALWDERRKVLFLARDPFGIKPLYYADDGAVFRFASQVKALAAGGAVNLLPDPAAQVGFSLWGHVPEPFTIYRGIQALPAGNTMWLDQAGRRELKPFVSIPDILRDGESRRQAEEGSGIRPRLRECMLDSVRHHLVADVPVGIFLSSGKDSTTLTALAAELENDIHTVTLGFEEFRGTASDETPLAELMARERGTRHHTIWISRADFESETESFLAAMDQPSIDGINSYFVSRAATAAGLKVVLSGLGGDEMFGGYSSFSQIPQLVTAASPLSGIGWLARGIRRITAPLFGQFTSPKYAGVLEYGGSFEDAYLLRRSLFMPWELQGMVDPQIAKEGLERLQTIPRLKDTAGRLDDPYLKVSALEMCWYMRNQLLRDMDWASMAHSLEVRVPFIDIALLRSLAPMLATSRRPTKADLVALPARPLPDQIVRRPKTGFSVPLRDWLYKRDESNRERGLRGWARRVVAEWPVESYGERPPSAQPFATGERLGTKSTAQRRSVILFASEVLSFGGIQTYMRRIMEVMSGLQGAGIAECYCISLNDPTPSGGHLENAYGRLPFVGAGRSKIRYLIHAYSMCRSPMTLVVGHVSLSPVAWWLRTIGRVSSYVVILHGIEAWSSRPWLERSALAAADRIVTTTKFTAAICSQANGIGLWKFLVLPLCVEDKGVAPAENFRLDGEFRILSVGRQDRSERYKGYETLIEAAGRLGLEHAGVRLHLVGDGNDHDEIARLVRKHGLDHVVKLWSFLDEAQLEAAYATCDVFALPSMKEGFGIVFLEAMRHGKPCIGGNHGGTPEVIVRDKTGVLVEYGDTEGLYSALLRLLLDPERRVRMGEAGRERLNQRFTFNMFRSNHARLMLGN